MSIRKDQLVKNRLHCTLLLVVWVTHKRFKTDHFQFAYTVPFWAATKANGQTKFEALLNNVVEAYVPIKRTRIKRAVVDGTNFWRFLFQSSETWGKTFHSMWTLREFVGSQRNRTRFNNRVAWHIILDVAFAKYCTVRLWCRLQWAKSAIPLIRLTDLTEEIEQPSMQ